MLRYYSTGAIGSLCAVGDDRGAFERGSSGYLPQFAMSDIEKLVAPIKASGLSGDRVNLRRLLARY
jgi:hypothetical protein